MTYAAVIVEHVDERVQTRHWLLAAVSYIINPQLMLHEVP